MTINNNSTNETQQPQLTKQLPYNLHVPEEDDPFLIRDQESVDTIIPTVEICRPTPSSSPRSNSPMVYDLNYLHPKPPKVLDKTLHESVKSPNSDSVESVESDLDLDCDDSECKGLLV